MPPAARKVEASASGSGDAPRVQNVRIDAASAGQRLDNFLAKILKGVPRAHLHRVIRSGEVRVNGGRAAADTRVSLGDEIRIPPVRVADRSARPAAPAREFALVHEDEALLCIDKPAGVAVHGGSGESHGVIEQLRRARPGAFLELVHRLDKETSGLLLIAKARPALVALQADLRTRQPGREFAKGYVALVIGDWPTSLKVIDVALRKDIAADGSRHVRVVDEDDARGRRSISLVRVARRFAGDFSLLDVTLKTGRTHQIRVHLADAGHAIVGDPKYGDFALNRALARGALLPHMRFERMFLHAARLRFRHPFLQSTLELSAPLPPACAALLDALGARAP